MFTTPREIALSLIFVVLQYFGPGMMKTVITLRTGNAWVHAIAYHSIAPHTVGRRAADDQGIRPEVRRRIAI